MHVLCAFVLRSCVSALLKCCSVLAVLAYSQRKTPWTDHGQLSVACSWKEVRPAQQSACQLQTSEVSEGEVIYSALVQGASSGLV